MLLSCVLQLTPLTPARLRGPSGRDAQGWLLARVARVDSALADRLHTGDGPRPYTTSGLMTAPWRPLTPKDSLTPDTPCFLRFTSIDETLSRTLLEHLVPVLEGETITLQKIDFEIRSVAITSEAHPWAGLSTRMALASAAEQNTRKSIRMHFATPTAFRSNGKDICLPLPEHILRSWWLRWNAFAPESLQIHPDWPKFAADTILVTRLHRLSTTRWRFSGNGRHGSATGFYGEVNLRLGSLPSDSIWLEHAVGAEHILQLLGAFALYAGTGHHTTIGMGQTRSLPLRSI